MPPANDTNSIDMFELRGPADLFAEIQSAMVEYNDKPNSRLLLFLLFSLNHLREWIAGSSYETLDAKRLAGKPLLPNEALYFQLATLEEFQTIRSLCNRSKHFSVRRGGCTSVTHGLTVESPCGDSLDQTYYRIDDIDSRDIFFPVMREYCEWFATYG